MRKSLLRMTLRQLQVFRAVCESRSYSRAAEAMSLTQPAVSLQIRQLEEQVGLPLFEYVGRKLYLTEAAESLISASDDIFDRLDSLEMNLSSLQGSLRGELRLAAASSIQYVLPHVLAAFRQRFPDISFRVEVASRAQIIQRLADNRDDVVLMGLVPEDRALEFFPVLNNPIVAVAAPDHPLAGQQQLPLSTLEAEMVLQREAGSGIRKACDEFLQLKRVHLQQVMQLGSTEALVQGAIAGLGVAMVPGHAAAPFIRHGELVCLNIAELPLMRSWCAVHARGKRLSPVAEAFLGFLREERALIRQLAEPFEP
ncbi:LysR family transcriptional regulator [Pseudomonas neustonica]|uniref:LysR family transcriptional regulator n=1 Tax=Pseudomonas neustonica TaxID=2487346 RepID=A0ABX9XP72_9PSED|nr:MULTISPECIES: LysR family transcriptional regulator [Pseudomonas]MAB25954.1 LysR family transcriptional regulator [Pseudomonadales bacterium]MBA6419426.1 LysR family transcriptional regulator [Pseudomonas sp. 5Ae-yellow]ROZ86062.1 LysR family transcriptional regulator [Pseudomonas sp. SSM44]ROZ87787.1 LysR family transcriptional regulator [Pseudomonas neustonica]